MNHATYQLPHEYSTLLWDTFPFFAAHPDSTLTTLPTSSFLHWRIRCMHTISSLDDVEDSIHLIQASEVCSCKPRRSGPMANLVHMGVLVGFLAALPLSFPGSSLCARATAVTETAATESSYSTIASPMAEYCSTDFSQVSYEDVKAACPADANQGANPACCAAFNNKACQYEAQVNNFGSMCPMLFINYLGAAGPYPAGYFVGPCVDGSKGFCIRH